MALAESKRLLSLPTACNVEKQLTRLAAVFIVGGFLYGPAQPVLAGAEPPVVTCTALPDPDRTKNQSILLCTDKKARDVYAYEIAQINGLYQKLYKVIPFLDHFIWRIELTGADLTYKGRPQRGLAWIHEIDADKRGSPQRKAFLQISLPYYRSELLSDATQSDILVEEVGHLLDVSEDNEFAVRSLNYTQHADVLGLRQTALEIYKENNSASPCNPFINPNPEELLTYTNRNSLANEAITGGFTLTLRRTYPDMFGDLPPNRYWVGINDAKSIDAVIRYWRANLDAFKGW